MRVLQVVLPIFLLGAVHSDSLRQVICTGKELSISNNSDILVDKECTHVMGDIVIANLTNYRLPVWVYRHVTQVYGSIIIWNNTNISPIIYFPRLFFINATVMPAIALVKNRNVRFEVGDHFKKAQSNHADMMFADVENSPSLSAATYNLLYIAGYPNSKFLTDSHQGAEYCQENLFKPLAAILGVLFVALTLAFTTIAYYDRKD